LSSLPSSTSTSNSSLSIFPLFSKSTQQSYPYFPSQFSTSSHNKLSSNFFSHFRSNRLSCPPHFINENHKYQSVSQNISKKFTYTIYHPKLTPLLIHPHSSITQPHKISHSTLLSPTQSASPSPLLSRSTSPSSSSSHSSSFSSSSPSSYLHSHSNQP
jgi:hypothetical protein